MTVPVLSIEVPGRASGLTAVREIADAWKTAVWQIAAAEWCREPLREPCAIDLTFRLPDARYRDTALFNLLKSTIDGLGRAIFVPSPVSQPGPWSTEDWWITELVARKTLTPSEASVRIDVAIGGGVAAARGPALAECFVPGSPPLWPGDSAGQRRVVAWRDRASEMLVGLRSSRPASTIGIALQFNVESSRMMTSDIDNFCVPAAQSVCYAMFGDLAHGIAVSEICVTKRMVDGRTPLGTNIVVWRTGTLTH